MSQVNDVLTPITQAMNEGAITRRELKQLMTRSDKPALLRLALWVPLVLATGYLIALAMGSIWFVPAMMLHGVVLVHHFSLQHECCHYTAFKTRWLNDLVGNLCGLVIMLPNRFFRYEHCDHHTFTQRHGHDPEMIELPVNLRGYLWYLSSVPYWRAKFSELYRHSAGHITPAEKKFIPKEERATIIREARLMALFYFAVIVACIVQGWTAPLWYWLIPVILGEPVMRAIRMTEHVGRPAVGDMRVNTRSNIVSAPWRFLCWNMNYHAEHHYASSVPFHALPALSEKLGSHVYTEKKGYFGAHIDMLAQILGRKPRAPSA